MRTKEGYRHRREKIGQSHCRHRPCSLWGCFRRSQRRCRHTLCMVVFWHRTPRSPTVPMLQKKHLVTETRESQGPGRVDGEWNHPIQLLLPLVPGGSYGWLRGGTRASLAVPSPRVSPSALGPSLGHLAWVFWGSAQAGTCCFLLVAELAGSSET